ncbi:unnamed protein product [Ceutorhynchus assimilis]|uniref:Homeobox domain-containing protein n=1 Tax=Ceutorhynchus assimilis TaxID=467358 RepID=A0A9N9MV44_9CUCU|nr:unnamed protein product [Ceutorhynchus assimilis]
MDIKIKIKEIINNKINASMAADKKNLLNEIQNSNIDVKVKIEKDLADLHKVDLLKKHNNIRIKEDPDSTKNFKNEEESKKSNQFSTVYIKQEIEDEDSAKEENPDPTDNKESKKEDNNRIASKYKTRTEFQYRVIYTPHQRIELEKEYSREKFVSLRRKILLARELGLSERQVKIWFQNRRSKERKLKKRNKAEEQPQTEQITDLKPQINVTSIDHIRDTILFMQKLQQSVLARFLANSNRHQPEN